MVSSNRISNVLSITISLFVCFMIVIANTGGAWDAQTPGVWQQQQQQQQAQQQQQQKNKQLMGLGKFKFREKNHNDDLSSNC